MPVEAPAKPGPNPEKPEDAGADDKAEKAEKKVEGPPDEDFWERYNNHLEFPISTVGAVLIHVLVAAMLVFGFVFLLKGDDKAAVPIKLVDSGFDDTGEGSAGSGGVDEPLKASENPFENIDIPPPPTDIPMVANPDAPLAAPKPDQPKTRSEKGSGNEKGRGYDGTAGKGPGGTGNDSTRARSNRWTLRFKTTGTRDYVDQLSIMGAIILVPIPPENKKFLIVKDLKNPNAVPLTDTEMAKLSDEQVKFGDNRKETVADMARILQLDFTPKGFWAVFPKGLEEDLAKKERAYRGKSPDSIDETIFQVTIRGNTVEITVVDQKSR